MLLTAADDRTARLWALGGAHAGAELVCFDRLRASAAATRDENPPFEQVQDAQFLCLDGAIAISTGARLGIYKYQLHVQDTEDDIKRLQRLGSYKCCGLLSLPREPTAGGTIVAVAANNSVFSGTVLVASSSKQIYAWDVAAERVLAGVREGSLHSRPITCLRLAQPHGDCQSAQAMDLFYTCAADGTARLWDLRLMRECQSFEGAHVHASQRLRCRLSPCLRFLCMPSEDGCICAYDVRTGHVLGSRRAHRDVVSAVDIHPRTGSLASGGYDGSVQFFRTPPPPGERGRGGRPSGGLVEPVGTRHQERGSVGVREVEMDLPF